MKAGEVGEMELKNVILRLGFLHMH